MDTLILALDLVGTFVFALSGAMMAVRRRLDLFGVLVLAFATASAGGILRDLLIGATPPAALHDWRYPAIWISAGLIAFAWSPWIERLDHPVRVFDALGLAVFAVAGTDKALGAGIGPLMAPCLGMLSGIGGGMLRDVLLARVPLVLHAELYAIAALAGASVVAIGNVLQLPAVPVTVVGAALCFFLRLAALRYGWHLPKALQAPPGDGSG
ncbi:trimeric intracellular cation channel family protein [Marilutibacter maris]|uniref:Membrane protein n=1 Tax=Marilutibacter maris TaxID=1605891 RepID=A0A2U9TH71_9GAMM|nr:trimeric intracellular cation channel family protein [Lysobacter maris]AWV07440.1 membrane protein [Lysobacter maris]KAB8198534.1 trimeric intracellular cation channel family protein [Lysobacter maris]